MLGSLVLHTLVVACAFVLVRHHTALPLDEPSSVSVTLEEPASIASQSLPSSLENLSPNDALDDVVPQLADLPTPHPSDQAIPVPQTTPMAETRPKVPSAVEIPPAKPPATPPITVVPEMPRLSAPAPSPSSSRHLAPAAPVQAMRRPLATLPPPVASAFPPTPSVLVGARPVGGLDGHCQPDYPASALRRGQQGLVVVRVTVSAQGQVTAANLAQSSGAPALDSAALAKVVHDCRFFPASRDGVPIEGVALQPMKFEIQG